MKTCNNEIGIEIDNIAKIYMSNKHSYRVHHYNNTFGRWIVAYNKAYFIYRQCVVCISLYPRFVCVYQWQISVLSWRLLGFDQ